MYKLQQFNFEKEKTILIPAKYNHTFTKEINFLRRFSDFKFFFVVVKNEKKIDNYGLNCHRYMVHPLVLRILR